MAKPLVLVTGGSGFIATYCILQLLEQGYAVRTTVRSLSREADVRATLETGGAEPGDRLTFVAADLSADAGWAEAVEGCDYVLHVASPFPSGVPKDESEVIRPARDGALRVLAAARDAGVKRVVLTSSFAAIGYGHPPMTRPFNEQDWTDLGGDDLTPYTKSKTIAERAAWDFIANEGGKLELATVNPVAVFGPVLGPDLSTSVMLIRRLLDGSTPGLPQLMFGVVDVRDVADLHLRAMTDPKAKGERFLAISGDFMTVKQMADTLRSRLGPDARKAPTRVLPNWVLRAIGLFDKSVGLVAPELGKFKNATGKKAVDLLGWAPRSREDALQATGESLFRLKLVK